VILNKTMPTVAYAKTWGCTKPFMPKEILTKPESVPEPVKPVLSTKSIQVETTTQMPVQKEIQIQTQKSGIPLWLVIVLGVSCGIFLLWAIVATISAQQTLRAHSNMLQNLILLASKYVKKSFEKAPETPRNINLDELLKSLQ
jgi:hypothetical protein